jgi:parallel beta-helix repeat protein
MKKLLLLAMVLFFTAMIARVQAANEIDIGVYTTSCSDFEVRLSSQFNITNTSLTNVQFAVKYPASVTIGDLTYPYPVPLQYTTTVGSDKYSVFIGVDVPITNWVAGTEYTVLTFSIDHAASSTVDLIIGNDTWTTNNNISYYAELLGIDKTGAILTGASIDLNVHNIDLGRYYCKIQEGIDDAGTGGETIEVSTGTFSENVVINKAGLTLINAASALPVIDGSNTGTVVTISANNVTLQGFKIQNSGATAIDAGVILRNDGIGGVTGCSVTGNEITGNANALGIILGSGNSITSNDIHNNSEYGILLIGSNGNTVEDNEIYFITKDAVALDNLAALTNNPAHLAIGSDNNYLKENTIYNISRDGIFIGHNCDDNEITDGNDISNITSIGIHVWRDGAQTITDNIIKNAAVGIKLRGSQNSTITDNSITLNGIGIEIERFYFGGNWYPAQNNTIKNNTISGNTTYGMKVIDNDGVVVNATLNWWGHASGPYNNPYNTCGQGNEVIGSLTFMPWWANEAMTISSGDLPVKNITKSPNTYYCKIQDAIDDADDGDEIHVAAGNYNESMDIAKPLTILGSGSATTIIDRSTDATAGDIVYIHDLNGNLIIDGFTFKTGPASAIFSNGLHIVSVTGGTCTISNNIIIAYQSTNGTAMQNYGVIAGYGSTAKLVFDNNTVYGGGDNPVLIERWLGLTEITNNLIHRGPEIITDASGKDVIFMMNYDTDNNNLQLISGNTIDLSGGAYNSGNRGVGITVATAVKNTTPAMFTNVEISGNTIINLNTNRRGISTWNNAPTGSAVAGDIRVVITNNEISPASGYTGEFGIRILGLSTVADILNNKINGVTDAVKIQPWNSHSASGVNVNNNYLGYTTGYGINNLSNNLVDGTCNWFENNGVHAVFGPVTYVPYLNDGTDGSGDIGFQPSGSCITPADFYVNDNSTLNDRFTTAIGNDGNMGTTTSPLATINKAISLATTGNNIWVDAGTYVEDVAIDKAVNLYGSNYDVDPNGLDPRNEETRIIPAHNSPYDDALISVESSNVSIKGLYLDGDNPAITGGEDVMGADVNMSDGIQNGPTYGTYYQIDHLNIENNIFRNFTYDGVFIRTTFGVDRAFNYIHHNYFENMWEGIQTYAIQADISDNKFISVNRGLSIHAVNVATDPLFVPRIANNDVTIDWTNPYNNFEIGIWVNYRSGSAPDLDVTNNTVTCPVGSIPAGKNFSGLYVMTISNDRKVTFAGNIVNGNGICNTGLYAGNISSNNVRITGGSLDNIKANGVIADNYNEVSQYKVAADVKITVDNVPITMGNTGAGIKAYANPLGAGNLASVSVINDCHITGGAQGVLATGYGASVTVTDNTTTISGNDVGIMVTSLGNLISCTGNTITNNNNGGIIIESSAGTIGNICENIISGNGYSYDSEHGLGLLNAKGTSVNATNNYWGHATGPYRLSDNSCGQGNAVSENVDICMWYTDAAMTPADLNGCVVLVFNVTGGGEYCFGGTGVLVGLDDSEVGVNYQLYLNGNPIGGVVAGDGDDITFGNQTSAGTYTVKATNTYTGCADVLMNSSATIIINPLPDAPVAGNVTVVYDGSIHTGTATAPSGSSVVWYDAATGGNISVAPSGTNVGVYTAWAESVDDVTGCISALRTQVTVTITPVTLGLKVMLQGPYSGVGLMNTDLYTNGQIPSGQPYNVAPWSYTGTETEATPPSTAVDWVLVELRSNINTMIGRSAALLNNDGTVNIAIDNATFPGVVSGSAYYIVIWHRNHMPVMSATAQTVPVTSYDFTVLGNLYGTNPAIDLGGGVYGLIAGDVTKNGMLKYSGPNNDRGPIIARIVAETGSNNTNGFTPAGYWQEDVTMNSIVLYLGSGNDRGVIQANLLTLTGTPYLNNTYTSVVPGAYTGGKDGMGDGPVDIQFIETVETLAIEIMTNEFISNGMVDNIQFTLAWKANDPEIEQLLSTLTSGFYLLPQGEVIEVGGINYLTFVSVTPTYLPQVWNSGETVTVLTFEKQNGQLISNRLWIAEDDFTVSNNGEYYVSNWGSDVTGIISTLAVGIDTEEAGFVKIYPNPVNAGNLFLQVNTVQIENLDIKIWDMTGKLIKKIEYQSLVGTTTFTIDVSDFNSGVYIINVIGDKVLYMDRFIVK